jgi:hypothetical protein
MPNLQVEYENTELKCKTSWLYVLIWGMHDTAQQTVSKITEGADINKPFAHKGHCYGFRSRTVQIWYLKYGTLY